MKEFKYLGTVLCKHGEMEREIIERVVKDRCIIWLLTKDYERKEFIHRGKESFKE